MTERRLAIAIPTYGNASWVARHLELMAPSASRLNVALYVSDDTPDDSVKEAVRAISSTIENLHYRHNKPPLGHDRNLVETLTWPHEEYVWLLRSAMWAKPETLEELISFLQGQDLVLVNSHSDDNRMIPEACGTAGRALLREALWHQTLTGATIYHRSVIDWTVAKGKALTIWPNFPQLSVMMGYASAEQVSVGWFGKACVNTSFYGQSYWRDRAVEVFVTDWTTVVNAFPKIVPPAERNRVIREHSRRMRLFDATTMMELRRTGQFSWASLRQPQFRAAMHLSLLKMAILLALPPRLFSAYRTSRAYLSRVIFRGGSA